jgi:hypothetical protein
MPTLQDFRDAIETLNNTFPRPGLVLALGQPYDLHTQYATQFPDSENPGVYALVAEDGTEVLRIGKAQRLGLRFGAYFMWVNREQGRGEAKDPDYGRVRYLVTVPLPVDRAFEAPSIEEFLFRRFRKSEPSLNVRFGRLED